MITLTLVFCLAAQQSCVERTMLPDPAFSSVMGCMVAGPQAAAGYLAEHPGWQLQRYRCSVGVPEQHGV